MLQLTFRFLQLACHNMDTPVAVALFGGWLIVVAMAGCCYLLHPYIGAETFLVCAAFLFIVADSVLQRWLMGKGAKIFEQLK